MADTHFSGPVVSTGGFTGDVTGDVTGFVTGTSEARTVTTDGTTTGTISAGVDFVTVTSDSADKILVLPAPVVGTVIHIRNAGTGYELRSSAPATVAINAGTGAAAESAVGANVLVRVVCDTATTWIANTFAVAGTEAALEAAA